MRLAFTIFLLVLTVSIPASIWIAHWLDRFDRRRAADRRLDGGEGASPFVGRGQNRRSATKDFQPEAESHKAIAWLQRLLEQSGSGLTPAALAGIEAALASLSLLLGWFLPLPLVMLALIGLASLPLLALELRRRRRLRAFALALPYLLDMLKSALESGHTLQRALQMAAARDHDIVADEVRVALDQVRLGMSLPLAIKLMHRRVAIPELEFLANAVMLQQQTGSNLAEILQHVSESIRYRHRLAEQIRSLTAQSRMSAMIVTALPIVVIAVFSLIRADHARVLFTDPNGKRLLEFALLLDGLALFAMRRIARVDY